MSVAVPFYSVNEAKKLPDSRVYHDNDACPAGRQILLNDRRYGANNYRLCEDCAKLNKAGR